MTQGQGGAWDTRVLQDPSSWRLPGAGARALGLLRFAQGLPIPRAAFVNRECQSQAHTTSLAFLPAPCLSPWGPSTWLRSLSSHCIKNVRISNLTLKQKD